LFSCHYIISKKKGFIIVVNKECLDLALEFKEKNFNPFLLNMASEISPGGGYKVGSAAQEESLFRRTCLYLALDRSYYPLDNYSGLYTPDVVVISENEVNNYKYYLTPKTMSIITLAAINLKKYKLSHNKIINITTKKIETIFKIAILNNHDSIILSAFGCGAYENDPTLIANIFKDVIYNNNYKSYFKHICFAIIGDNNSEKHGGNLKIFKNILES
jgi:uncharacterized protein (TIGR02452 family)